MTVPSEIALLHYGKEIVILADRILDLITNLLISDMVFVRDIQKPSIASQFKGIHSSFEFLSHHLRFSLERAVWIIRDD